MTVDHRLLRFDRQKTQGRDTNAVPICVHPAVLIQMLQLWLPRTPRFDEAMLQSVRCASSKLLRPRNQGLTLRLNSGPKTAKLRRYAQRCCLPRLTWRPCHSGDVSAPRRPGVGERRFAAASDGAEERAPTPTARRHGTGFLGCPSRFVARVGEPPAHRPRGHRSPSCAKTRPF